MNKTFTTLATLAAVVTANPVMARSSHSAHVALAEAVERAGVDVYVNHKICDDSDSYGMYIPAHNAIVVCQENRVKGSRNVVAWTEEDYDTLRHEVHHVVQDCMDDSYNGILSAVYKDPIGLGYEVMGKTKTHRIAALYDDNGASDHIQVMEIEAFSVAAMNDPYEQIGDIQRYCF